MGVNVVAMVNICMYVVQQTSYTHIYTVKMITEANDEYLAGHKNNKPSGTRVSLELDNNNGRILQFNN
jgi:hypothetical protein